MGTLAKSLPEVFEQREPVIQQIRRHFALKRVPEEFELVSKASGYATVDDILFEEFELWTQERNDDALIFQIRHFFETKDAIQLSARERDLTDHPEAIKRLESEVRHEVTKRFKEKLARLARERGLDTDEKLGTFLHVSRERARVMLSGKHKPVRKTLCRVAEAFGVDVEELI